MAGFALAAKIEECFFPVHSFHAATPEVVVAGVKHFSRFCEFMEISRHCIFNQIVRCAAGACGELLNARLGFGAQVNFRGSQSREAVESVSNNRILEARASPPASP